MNIFLILLITFNTNIEGYRTQTRDFLMKHFEIHKDCETKESLADLNSVSILPGYHSDPYVHGWILDGKIYMNTNKYIKWNNKKVIFFFIHELKHKKGDCLGDSIKIYPKPICKFLGKDIYHSMDMSKAIKNHFKGE